MLYHFLNSLLAISSVGGYLMLLAAVAFVGMFVYLGLTNLFRILMGGLLVLEAYQMSASFACNGSNFLFQRASGTLFACDPVAYKAYTYANFGIDQWHILALYGMIGLFMIWPFFGYIRNKIQSANYNKSSSERDAALQRESRERISRIERIGGI